VGEGGDSELETRRPFGKYPVLKSHLKVVQRPHLTRVGASLWQNSVKKREKDCLEYYRNRDALGRGDYNRHS